VTILVVGNKQGPMERDRDTNQCWFRTHRCCWNCGKTVCEYRELFEI